MAVTKCLQNIYLAQSIRSLEFNIGIFPHKEDVGIISIQSDAANYITVTFCLDRFIL